VLFFEMQIRSRKYVYDTERLVSHAYVWMPWLLHMIYTIYLVNIL
jgi:hypothetical protein